MINFVEQEHGDVTHLALQGPLTIEVEKQMAAKNEQLVALGRTRVVLDLAGVKYIDSSGIGAIVSLFKRVRLVQGDVKLASLNGQPGRSSGCSASTRRSRSTTPRNSRSRRSSPAPDHSPRA
ncbi:MAG: hypothetical protein DMF81_23855 [Acidobacteria bacterium]|nr:MAG: hypothetical protein DMF81_23855 [Acidobacteriota bacterium]